MVDLPTNRFKQRMLAGEQQLGLWMALGNASTAELCAGSAFDWLLIDCEHGPNTPLTALAQLQAVAPYSASGLLRVPTGDSVTIKRYLDIGAQTLLIPMVETAEQASSIAAAAAYAPEGIRGLASMTRAGRYGRIPDYFRRTREQNCIIPQIETVTALENLEAIAAVPGIDAIFVGPADLSASMGYLGQGGHPDVLAAVENAITRGLATGKPVGIFTLDEALAKRYLEMGCSFVAIGADALLLAKAVDQLHARFCPAAS